MRIPAMVLSLVLVTQPTLAWADEPGIALITRSGAPAPFEGVLYSTEAYARMKADQEQHDERLKLQHDLDLGLLGARLTLRSSTTANALDACRSEKAGMDKIKDDQIKGLNDRLQVADDRAQEAHNVATLEKLG